MQICCDVCEKILDTDDRTMKAFTLAHNQEDKELRVMRWPIGYRLRDKHEGLEHACSNEHFQILLAKWI